MDAKRIRIALIERGQRLVDLHRATAIPYNRLVRLVNGYCDPRPDEVERISSALQIQESEVVGSRP